MKERRMRPKINTETTSDDMDYLWGMINTSREKTTVVSVNKEVMTRLLLDHGRLLNYYLGRPVNG
jgi:hypothetical protein